MTAGARNCSTSSPLTSPLNTMVRDLSGGTKQQVSLAAALLHDPEIIFLDEPTAGVTPASRSRFWQLIRKLADRNKTVFVTTHYMDEAEQCDRIALMREGKIIALDTPDGSKRATFPTPMLEFDPQECPQIRRSVRLMARHEVFSFFRTLRPPVSRRDQKRSGMGNGAGRIRKEIHDQKDQTVA